MNFKITKIFADNQKALDDGFRYIVNSGGSRSSKTYSIVQLFVVLLLTRHQYKISCFRNLRIDCIDTVGEDFKDIIMGSIELQSKFIHNVKGAYWRCKANGSTIYFQGTEKIHKSLGQKNDIIFLNEISSFSQDVFNQLDQRTRDAIYIDYNPSKEFWIEKYRVNPAAIFLHSTYKNNPFLTEGIIAKLEGYNPFEVGCTYVENRKLMYNGELVSDVNQPPPHIENLKNGTADRYLYEVYCLGLGSEKPNRIFKDWETCTEEDFCGLEYTSYYGLDFGISAETAVVEVKYDGDRTFYVRQRLYKPSSKMGMPLAEYLLTQMSPPITGSDLIVCDSAKLAMVNELKYGGLKATPALKGPGSVAKNISNVQSINIVFTDTSLDLEEEYFTYSYKLDRYGLTTDEIDKSTKNHAINSLEYIISYLFSYLRIRFK